MKKACLIAICWLALYSISIAQNDRSVQGTWYMIDMSGESTQRIILTKKEMITQRWITYNVDKPYWKEDKRTEFVYFQYDSETNKARVLAEDNRIEGVSPGELWTSRGRSMLYFYHMNNGFSDRKDALKSLDNFQFKDLTAKALYSKDRVEKISQLPSTEGITKDQFVKLVKIIQSHDQILSDFLDQNNTNNAQRALFYIVDNLFKQGLIEMGYNPWKPTDSYFVDRFRNDPEVAELLDKQVHLKF